MCQYKLLTYLLTYLLIALCHLKCPCSHRCTMIPTAAIPHEPVNTPVSYSCVAIAALTTVKSQMRFVSSLNGEENSCFLLSCYLYAKVAEWLGSRALNLRSSGCWFDSHWRQYCVNNLGQVVYTNVPLSPSSVTWYG